MDLAHSQELGLFRLRRWGGSLRFRLQREKRISNVQSREHSYNAILALRNSGFIISPEVFNFKWNGDLALFLEQFITQQWRRDSHGRFLGHTLSATFFQSSPNSLIFFWNKNANVIKQDAWGRTNYDTNNLQANLNMLGTKFKSRLWVAWRDLREEWNRAGFQASRNQLRRSLNYRGSRDEEQSNLQVDYNFVNIRDRIRTTSSYSRHTAGMRYRRAFGDDQTNIWDSDFRLFIRKGISDHQNIKLNQSLKLQHLQSLTSRYRHTLTFTRTAGGTILQNTASASILHRLYSSLSTNFGFGGTHSTMFNGNIYIFSLGGGINYTKKIPLSGRIQIGYARGYSINDLQIEATEQSIVNERHIFIGGLPVRLVERNIIISSIVVFDQEGEFIFEEGDDKDYVIRIIGDYVEIEPNPFGRIREDDAILVSYRFRTLPAMRYSTSSNTFNAGLNFGWLSLSYRVNRHDQELLAGDAEALESLQDLFTKVAQLQMTLRGENAGTSFFAERKIYESTALAFKAVDLRYAFFLRPIRSLTLSSNFTFSQLNHQRKNLKITAYAMRSELRWRPSLQFILQAYGKYNLRKETIQADEGSFEYGGSIERFWRVFRLLLRYEKRKWEFGLRHINERRFTFEIERIF
ncbi:MAG: hypothetical protein ACE5HI_09825 [bacterium]